MSRYVLIILLNMLLFQLTGQNQPRKQSLGNWIMYFGDNKINKKYGIHTEYQSRNYFIPGTLTQTLLRVGLNRYLSPAAMLTGGYGFIHTIPASGEGGFTTIEHRIWEQMILRHRSYNVFLEHRYRLEQRFVKNLTNNEYIFDNRIRYRLQALVPMYNISPYLRHFFLSGYNEIFMNLGRKHSGQLFDRNRLYFAVGYQFDPKLNIQIGYLNQVIAMPDALIPEINHNFQMSVIYNMDDLSSLFSTKK